MPGGAGLVGARGAELAALSPRRFDGELSQAHEEAQRERLQREKLSREKDVLVAEVFGLKQLLEVRDARHLAARHAGHPHRHPRLTAAPCPRRIRTRTSPG